MSNAKHTKKQEIVIHDKYGNHVAVFANAADAKLFIAGDDLFRELQFLLMLVDADEPIEEGPTLDNARAVLEKVRQLRKEAKGAI